VPKSPSKKTLAAQAAIKADQANRLFQYQTSYDRNQEAVRAALMQGLGSSAQLSGAYSGAAAQPARDYSKYSQKLIVTNRYLGDMAASISEMRRQGKDPATMTYRAPDESYSVGDMLSGQGPGPVGPAGALAGSMISHGGGKSYYSPEQMQAMGWIDEEGNPIAGVKGSPWKFDKKTGEFIDKDGDGQPDRRSRFHTVGELAAKGKKGAISQVRNWELANQISEVNDLFEQANAAAREGNFELADQLHAQATDLVSQYGFNEEFDSTGLGKETRGVQFSVEQGFDAVGDPTGQAEGALGSESGMAVGQLLHKARQLQDPNSAETAAFKNALTSGAIAAVDAARTNALRAMATEERGSQRAMRDMALQSGQASQTAKMAAVAARNSERFGTLRAGLETDVGARKAQIYADAEKLYQSFSVDLVNNAVGLASAWVNDQSGVRDSFRAMHANMMMNYTSNLLGFASNANNNVTQLLMADMGGSGGGGFSGAGAAGGALSGAAAGATVGSVIPGIGTAVGAIAGGVLGAVGGGFGG
jgi:hypothetical protein